MALTFNGTTQYLSLAVAASTTAVCSIAGWVNVAGGVAQTLASIGVASGATSSQNAVVLGNTNLAQARTWVTGGGSSGANTAGAITLSAWVHLLGVFTTSSSRDIYVNGGSTVHDVGTEAVSGLNITYIGVNWQSALVNFMAGSIAFPVFWNVALSATDAVTLATGISPRKVHPESIVFFPPLSVAGTPQLDFFSSTSWTAVNTPTIAVNPRTYGL